MRNSYELNECVGRPNLSGVRTAVHSIANNHLAAGWQLAFGAGADQGSHLMPLLEKPSNERAPEIPGAAANKDAMRFVFNRHFSSEPSGDLIQYARCGQTDCAESRMSWQAQTLSY